MAEAAFDLEKVNVTNNQDAHRFEAQVAGQTALLSYRRSDGQIALVHTEVPAPLQKRGLAAKLVQSALEFARASDLAVVPICPYVAAYLRKHAEYKELVRPNDWERYVAK